MTGRSTLGVAGLVLLTVCSGVTFADGSKCSSAKIKAAGKKAGARAKCYGKAIAKNTTVDGACLQKATDGFTKAFTKAEGKGGCLAPNGDQGTIETKVDNFVDQLRNAINGGAGGPSKCDSKKLAAATKKAGAKAGCHSKAVGKGVAVDPGCLNAAEGKFSAAMTKIESGDDCTSSNQTNSLEGIVDAFIADLVSELAPASTPTTTTTSPGATTTTTLGSHVCGNGTTEGPAETCDDGNAVDENTVDSIPPDACPASCRIESCTSTSGTVSVSVNFASSSSV